MKSKPLFTDGYTRVDLPEDLYVPGMLVASPESGEEHFSCLSDEEVLSISRIERQLRVGTKVLFDVALAGIYIEEQHGRGVSGYTIPFYVDRLKERFDLSVYQPHIADYLKSYTSEDKSSQLDAAGALGDYLIGAIDLVESARPTEESHHVAREKLAIQEVLDINDELELPSAPLGMKYYVCIGGSKNFQAFLTEDSLSKGEFLEEFASEIDEALSCIYEDDTIAVRQDAKYAIPGFYIISPKSHYRSIDAMPQAVLDQSLLAAHKVQQCLESVGIHSSHIYHDEKFNSPASAHFWVLPLHDQSRVGTLDRTIQSKDVWTYLENYPRFSSTKDKILQYNDQMRELLR